MPAGPLKRMLREIDDLARVRRAVTGSAHLPNARRRSAVKSFAFIEGVAPVHVKAKNQLSRQIKQRLLNHWFKACGTICMDCGAHMLRPRSGQNNCSPRFASIDHIRARCLGGTNALSNLRVICCGCNGEKSKHESLLAPVYQRKRKRMLSERAKKAARTRARNKLSAQKTAVMKAHCKARVFGASEQAAYKATCARRPELETGAAG